MPKPTARALGLLLLSIAVYYWKILFTDQFSLLTVNEGASQAYAWLHYWIASIRTGTSPLWDPYAFSGHPFAGEMQTQAFYPLHLVFLLVPLAGDGSVLARAFEYWFVFSHFLGACFMFALARELGLGRFPAMIAGLSFSLGNFLAISSWPHFWETGIWLPVVLLFLLRALRAEDRVRLLSNAVLSGLALGLSILAGGLHIAMETALVVVTAGVFAGFARSGKGGWTRPALAVATVGAASFCAGAVQLFASIEYSKLALRWITGGPAQPASQAIPYTYLTDHLWPQGLVGMLIPRAFGGNLGAGETWAVPAYIGALPVLAAIAGIWKCWDRPWVRYLAGLAVLAFLYSLGPLSLLHGVLYALVPWLSLAREADRFLFLASFALAILAGFGLESLMTEPVRPGAWSGLRRALRWGMLACGAAVSAGIAFGNPAIDPLVWFSLLVILAACGLLLYATYGHTGIAVKVLMAGLLLFDLSAFFPSAVSKSEASAKNQNELEKLQSLRGVADFLKSRPGLFRTLVLTEPRQNLGDMYQVQCVVGTGVTMLKDYHGLLGRMDLFNARFVVRPASSDAPGAVYRDAAWKVYEDPKAFPRAWVVHETRVVQPAAGAPAGVDARSVAFLGAPLTETLEPAIAGAAEEVVFTGYAANRMEMNVRTSSRGLLVLSELFYPGWHATVNGAPAAIYKVDGALRGILVPAGSSRVVLEYRPASVIIGGILSVATFAGGLLFVGIVWRRKQLADSSSSR